MPLEKNTDERMEKINPNIQIRFFNKTELIKLYWNVKNANIEMGIK